MISDRINKVLTGSHLDAFRAFATRIAKPGQVMKTPDVIDAAIETLPEFEKLMGIKTDGTTKALRKLACLGNGYFYGNSEGNVIAQKALGLDPTKVYGQKASWHIEGEVQDK